MLHHREAAHASVLNGSKMRGSMTCQPSTPVLAEETWRPPLYDHCNPKIYISDADGKECADFRPR